MASAWAPTDNIDLAAALRVLGFPLRTDIATDERSGKGWKKILIGQGNVPSTAFCTVGLLQSSVIRRQLGDKENPLWKADPSHPVLDVLAAYQNRERLVEAMKTGVHLRLDDDALLRHGDEPPGVQHAPEQFRTGQVDMAAALTRMGFRLARITGSEPHCNLFLADPGARAITIVRHYRAGTLDDQDASHVRLRFLMTALQVRAAVRDYVTGREQRILIRAPHSQVLRSSLVPESADNKTLDAVRKHILG